MIGPDRSLMKTLGIVFLILFVSQVALADELRVALVIGNSDYQNSPLKNPGNDAEAMARALSQVGFEVIKKTNLTQKEMKMAIDEFGRRLGPDCVALFFFAGHGMQVNGNNYLMPLQTRIESEEDVEYEAVRADRVLAKMERAQPRVNIVILDACRNNPFARSFRSGRQGLAHMDAPSGTIIAYATAPGSVASDGAGDNGLYTQELIKNITTPGLAIEEVFKRVRVGVQDESGKEQIPWESSSLVGNFYFAGGPAQQQAPSASTSGAQTVASQTRYGRVKVVSNVEGASFNLAGRQYTTRSGADMTIDQVPSGPHTITVHRDGYSDWQSVIVVQNGGTVVLNVHLNPISPQQSQTLPPATNVGPGPTRFFTDPVMNFSINIPTNWAANNFNEDGDRVLAMMSPDQNVSFRIRAFPVGPGASLDQMRVVFETLLQNTILNNTGQTAEVNRDELGELSGITAVYNGYYNNIMVNLVAFYTIQNQKGYILWTMIPTNMFDQRIQEVLALAETFSPGW